MDLQQEELQFLTLTDIIRESISIPRRSPKTFNLITLALVFPLSFAILAHSLFTQPIVSRLQDPDLPLQAQSHQWALLLTFQFLYLLFLFSFSLLSTAAVVFTVASLYSSGAHPVVSFPAVLSAVPSVFRRLLLTFLWISLLMLLYNLAFLLLLLLLLVSLDSVESPLLFILALLLSFSLFLFIHVFITALWHLASVVSVLEPFYGFAAMKKSYELLKGRVSMASRFVFAYLFICGLINGLFASVVVNDDASQSVLTRVVVGGLLVAVLVVVNLVGLLVQSVFYYVCKSFHHQGIDKTALHDHLGGYLGEYVPLKSSIQMETLDI